MTTNIVVLGGGYGGMRVIQRLTAGFPAEDFRIILIDMMPYHSLKTEFYALAAGTEPDVRLRVNFPDHPMVHIKNGEVTSIDLHRKQVLLAGDDPVSYDYLVIGLGCEDKYHGVPGAPEHTYSLQTMNKARETYHALADVRANGKVFIVGGGLSGVELASELRESRSDLQITIFDRSESILSPFPERLRHYVRTWFKEHDVSLANQSDITAVETSALYNHGKPESCDVIVWTAGIQAHKVVRALPVESDAMGRAVLSKLHYLPEFPEVFVVGDCASLPHAPSAQLAEAQGDQIAQVIKAMLREEKLPVMPRLKLKGVLGSLGKKHGFGLMGEHTLLGRVPRVLKSGVLWMYKNHSG